jgi:hypothetical protein
MEGPGSAVADEAATAAPISRCRVGGGSSSYLAAAILLTTRRSATTPARDDRPFVPIPYTAPLSKYENASVVRVNVSVAALLAAGYEIPAADPSAVLSADVLVGEDGRPHAIRLTGR